MNQSVDTLVSKNFNVYGYNLKFSFQAIDEMFPGLNALVFFTQDKEIIKDTLEIKINKKFKVITFKSYNLLKQIIR